MSRVLVTGATAGIGRAIVERLAADGHDVTAVARRADRLEDLAARTGCRAEAGDVTDLARMTDIVAAARPQVLVNNAGIGLGISGLHRIGIADIDRAIRTNLTSAIQLTHLALPAMRAEGAGHVVNMGSIAGLHTMISALYGAGKAAMHLFSQNLRQEVLGTGIRVTEICPGRVTSEFYDDATGNIEATDMGAPPIRGLDPEDVADAVAYALSAPAHVNISTIELLPVGQAVGGVRFGEPGSRGPA